MKATKSNMSKAFKAKSALRMADGGLRRDSIFQRYDDKLDSAIDAQSEGDPSVTANLGKPRVVSPLPGTQGPPTALPVDEPNIVSRGIDAIYRGAEGAYRGLRDTFGFASGGEYPDILGPAEEGRKRYDEMIQMRRDRADPKKFLIQGIRGARGLHIGPGEVDGPGGPRDDKIPALYSDGEYVLPAKTVKALGGPEELDELVMKTNDGIAPHGAEERKERSILRAATGAYYDDEDYRIEPKPAERPAYKAPPDAATRKWGANGYRAGPAPGTYGPAPTVPSRLGRVASVGKSALRGAGLAGAGLAAYEGLQALGKGIQEHYAPEKPDFISDDVHQQVMQNRGLDDSYGYDMLRGRFQGGKPVTPTSAGDPVTGRNPVQIVPTGPAPAAPAAAPAPVPVDPRERMMAVERLRGDMLQRSNGRGLRALANDDVALSRANQMYAMDNAPINVERGDNGRLGYSGVNIGAPTSATRGLYTKEDAARDASQLDAAVAARVASGAREDLEAANRIAVTPEQKAAVNAAYAESNRQGQLRTVPERIAKRMLLDRELDIRKQDTAERRASGLRREALDREKLDLDREELGVRKADLAERRKIDLAQLSANYSTALRNASDKQRADANDRLDKQLQTRFVTKGPDGKDAPDTVEIERFKNWMATADAALGGIDPKTGKENGWTDLDGSTKSTIFDLSPAGQERAMEILQNRYKLDTEVNAGQEASFTGRASNRYDPFVRRREAELGDLWKGLSARDYIYSNLPYTDPNVLDTESGRAVLNSRVVGGPILGENADRAALVENELRAAAARKRLRDQ